MTIEQMKNIANDTMNTDISYLARGWLLFDEVRATLFAFYLVDLFSEDEYRDYCDLIRQTENDRISLKQIGSSCND